MRDLIFSPQQLWRLIDVSIDVQLRSLVQCKRTTPSTFITINLMYFLIGNSYHTACMKQTRDLEAVCVVDIQLHFQKTIRQTRKLSIFQMFYFPSTRFASAIIWSSFFRIYSKFFFQFIYWFYGNEGDVYLWCTITCYFPAHIAFFNFIKLMIEGRLQAKTPVVSPFISVTGHTYVGMGQ